MKKVKESDELRPEYRREDLGKGIRGKYFEAYQKGADFVHHLVRPRSARQSKAPDTIVTRLHAPSAPQASFHGSALRFSPCSARGECVIQDFLACKSAKHFKHEHPLLRKESRE